MKDKVQGRGKHAGVEIEFVSGYMPVAALRQGLNLDLTVEQLQESSGAPAAVGSNQDGSASNRIAVRSDVNTASAGFRASLITREILHAYTGLTDQPLPKTLGITYKPGATAEEEVYNASAALSLCFANNCERKPF